MTSSHTEPLTIEEAESLIDEAEAVVACLQLPLSDAKALRERLLGRGIPATLGRDDHCTSGCSPKVLLLARPVDVPEIGRLLREDWMAMLPAEGCFPSGDVEAAEVDAGEGEDGEAKDGEAPCPACGHAGPLQDDGACADCGLVLA